MPLGLISKKLSEQANVQNNDANIQRIEEELKGQEDRSGGIVTQIEQTRDRVAVIEETLKEKRRELEQQLYEVFRKYADKRESEEAGT